jgi:hypothetical protein
MFLVFIDNESGTRRDYQLAMFWVAMFHYSTLPYSSRAPKRVKMPNGSDTAVIDNGKPNTIGITRSVRIAHADLAKQVPTFETCAGIGTPEQRLAK